MMKNEKGVTLIALVVTIIVLGIIATVSIQYGTRTVTDVENKKIMTELANVQQAVFEQYILLRSYGSEGQIPEVTVTNDITLAEDTDRPLELFGTRIVNTSTLEGYGFTTYKMAYKAGMPYENYYYILTKSDLSNLGMADDNVEDKSYSYIVNYVTGEIFDLEHIVYIDEYDSTLGSDPRLTGGTTKVEEDEFDFTE